MRTDYYGRPIIEIRLEDLQDFLTICSRASEQDDGQAVYEALQELVDIINSENNTSISL